MNLISKFSHPAYRDPGAHVVAQSSADGLQLAVYRTVKGFVATGANDMWIEGHFRTLAEALAAQRDYLANRRRVRAMVHRLMQDA
jgi:hypothetical protein